MNCQRIALKLSDSVKKDEPKRIIVGNTVTGVCATTMNGDRPCDRDMVTITPVSANHMTISGTLSTTNIIMANWNRIMWQSVVNRAVRMLTSGPLGSHFFSASAIVGGN
ncbi:hypothetical protein KIN20_030513 [Parelaphostrongylus tenuis]|uniref:Uncharacterized protein n=1 Tax=Parelaphostrongylus tenuis TaxID=148309 RepID=A0AAD5R4A8_PARTN|nr:hypothetical protein KIN20_030513 [Parelaphostrongylus tenuis]